jgi:hypothetical protein
MRGLTLIAATGALGLMGCAAVFRDSKPTVHFDSDPPGASAAFKDREARMPADVPVPRSGITEVRVTMPGFEEHHGLVRKHVNGLWLTADLATCIIPVLICIPLLVDAISGAWTDVEERYRAHLVPLGLAPLTPNGGDGGLFGVKRAPPPPRAEAPAPAPPPPPAVTSTISESERKASARAAYQEGVELQTQKSYPEALARFQSAQRLFDAPTHLLHIAQCLAATGKLVEAQEAYETLMHHDLAKGAPEPFREAVESGKRELAELQPRIPTLRIEVQPSPSTLRNLALQLNGRPMPTEVIGIARPVNPGTYRVTATAWGIGPSKPVEVVLEERSQKSAMIRLGP